MNSIFDHKGGPIHPEGIVEPAGWYFLDETESNYYGPYATSELAGVAQTQYATTL